MVQHKSVILIEPLVFPSNSVIKQQTTSMYLLVFMCVVVGFFCYYYSCKTSKKKQHVFAKLRMTDLSREFFKYTLFTATVVRARSVARGDWWLREKNRKNVIQRTDSAGMAWQGRYNVCVGYHATVELAWIPFHTLYACFYLWCLKTTPAGGFSAWINISLHVYSCVCCSFSRFVYL